MKPKPSYSLRRAISTTFANCDGPINTVTRAVKLVRREGLAGLFRGVKIVAASGVHANDYYLWISKYDTMTSELRKVLHFQVEQLSTKPVISVVMPTYNAHIHWLIDAIESVRNQIYPYWELCIADDASTNADIRPLLERYAAKDSRIKVVFRENNGHISAASNSALELATGEWVALLDHDDLLSEHALFWLAKAINENPAARLIYSDEDKIDKKGARHDPYFKCDFNVDLLYSQNMMIHLAAYQRKMLSELGGFRAGLEGSQDHDLALRCIEKIAPDQVYHIPRVLYHWRTHAESTARSPSAKPYAVIAGERALTEHFQRQNVDAVVEGTFDGYRVKYDTPNPPPLVTLIIPTKNGYQLIKNCIESILFKTNYTNYEILIVDNASDEPLSLRYFEELQLMTNVRVLLDDRPFNYSALNNAAVKVSSGTVLALLNNDLEVITPDWLSEMVSIAVQPQVGAVGARLWYPDNKLQHGGVVLGLGGVAGHAHKYLDAGRGYCGRAVLIQSFSAVTAACLVIRKEIYEEVGGLNETDLPVAFNDVDFCLRIREAGYRNVWTPYAELYHHESVTRGAEDTPEKQARFTREIVYMKERWGDLLQFDPAYNPNLTLTDEDFSLAFPPRIDHTGKLFGPSAKSR